MDDVVKKMHHFLKRQLKAWKKNPSKPVPFAMIFAGGTASGKTMLMEHLEASLQKEANVQHSWQPQHHGPVTDTVVLDNYFVDRSTMRKEIGDIRFFEEADLDNPKALTWKPVKSDLKRLKRGEAARIPHHTYIDASTRTGQTLKVPSPFLLVDGYLALLKQKVRQLFDVSIFVDADEKARSERWWKRANERIKNADEVKNILFKKAMVSHNTYIEPTKAFADIVINNQGNSAERLKEVKTTVDELAKIWVKTTYPVKHDWPEFSLEKQE
jgi:uridine kinase